MFDWIWGSGSSERDNSEAWKHTTDIIVLSKGGKTGDTTYDELRGSERTKWIQWRRRIKVTIRTPEDCTEESVQVFIGEDIVRCLIMGKYFIELPLLKQIDATRSAWSHSKNKLSISLYKNTDCSGQWSHLVNIPSRESRSWLSYDWDGHTEEDEEVRMKKSMQRQAMRQHQETAKYLRMYGDFLLKFIGQSHTASKLSDSDDLILLEKPATKYQRRTRIRPKPQSAAQLFAETIQAAGIKLPTPVEPVGPTDTSSCGLSSEDEATPQQPETLVP